MWHGALDGVPTGGEHDAVDHVNDALDLAAKIGVPGRIDNIDGDIAVYYARVFCQNSDAAFALEVVGVEHALDDFLVRF